MTEIAYIEKKIMLKKSVIDGLLAEICEHCMDVAKLEEEKKLLMKAAFLGAAGKEENE